MSEPTPDPLIDAMNEDERALLIEAGVLAPSDRPEAWRPTTFADLDRLGWRIECKRREAARLRENAEKRATALEKEATFLQERYSEDCREVLERNLPRKADGSYRKKSETLDHVTVSLRAVGGDWRVVDEGTLVEYAKESYTEELIAALKFTPAQPTCTGDAALACIWNHAPGTAGIASAPLKAYLASLPPVQEVDAESGEVTRETVPTLPGVEWVPRTEKFDFKAPKESAE